MQVNRRHGFDQISHGGYDPGTSLPQAGSYETVGSTLSADPYPIHSAGCVGGTGQVHLIYAMKEGSFAVQLPGEKDYAVELIDTWNMTAQELNPAKAGEFKFTAPRSDYLLRLTAANEE